MDFEFSEKQKVLKTTIEKVVEREVEPILASYPSHKSLPKEACVRIVRLVQPLGMLGAGVLAEDGGTTPGAVGVGILAETMPAAAFNIVLGPTMLAMRIALGGDQEQKRRFLPAILAGDKLGSGATSEPNVGSDPTGIETKATLVGGKYVINGTKLWISNAGVADILVVIASTGRDEKGRNLLTPFLVEKGVSSYRLRELEMLGMNQVGLFEVVFEDCYIPKENMLARAQGHALRVFTPTWMLARPLAGLAGVSCAQKALQASIRYAQETKQFGKPIGSFQSIQSMIVEMAALVKTSQLLCYEALSLVDKGTPSVKASSMAKYFATEAAVKVCSMAIELYGADGLSWQGQLEALFRDAKMLTILDATTKIQQLIVGREILGIRAFV